VGSSLEKIQHYLKSKQYSAEMIAVDDGSTDQTGDLLRGFALTVPAMKVLRNQSNRGKGFSVRRGALEAQGQLVLLTDADLSAPIEEAGKLLDALERTHADAAVGSRALQPELIGAHQPRLRELGGRFLNLLVRRTTGLNILDTQCGLKLFRRVTTRRAFELQRLEGFSFDFEVLFLIERLGGKIVEVPVRWNNDPATKVHVLRDGWRACVDLAALRWRAATGKYPLVAPSPGGALHQPGDFP
jgi:dolichyl-phosphate beta-glucosyltransferase